MSLQNLCNLSAAFSSQENTAMSIRKKTTRSKNWCPCTDKLWRNIHSQSGVKWNVELLRAFSCGIHPKKKKKKDKVSNAHFIKKKKKKKNLLSHFENECDIMTCLYMHASIATASVCVARVFHRKLTTACAFQFYLTWNMQWHHVHSQGEIQFGGETHCHS